MTWKVERKVMLKREMQFAGVREAATASRSTCATFSAIINLCMRSVSVRDKTCRLDRGLLNLICYMFGAYWPCNG
jgi:hypothetical protein